MPAARGPNYVRSAHGSISLFASISIAKRLCQFVGHGGAVIATHIGHLGLGGVSNHNFRIVAFSDSLFHSDFGVFGLFLENFEIS